MRSTVKKRLGDLVVVVVEEEKEEREGSL